MKIEARPPRGPVGPFVRPELFLEGEITGSDEDALIEAIRGLGPGDVTLDFEHVWSLEPGGVKTVLSAAEALRGPEHLYLRVPDGPVRDGLKRFRFPHQVSFAES